MKMTHCLPCEAERLRLKAIAYQKLKDKAIDYANAHGLKKMLIVQTKNFPNFKREDDPTAANFPIIEILLID